MSRKRKSNALSPTLAFNDFSPVAYEYRVDWFMPESSEAFFVPASVCESVSGSSSSSILDQKKRVCSKELQLDVWRGKHALDRHSRKDIDRARDQTNLFGKITREFFQNRAALKIAEIDAECGWVVTRPLSWQRRTGELKSRTAIRFIDLCGGPGGFSEYFLTAWKWRCQGFGITLTGPLDFQLQRFNSDAPLHSFRTHYGADKTGDLTRRENILSFCSFVGDKVDVAMADGGIEVSGREDQQEILSFPLVLAQCATAMKMLRAGGTLVCKLFDVWHSCTVELLFLVQQGFARSCILKPNQSRPANSERYFVCCDKLPDSPSMDALSSFLLSRVGLSTPDVPLIPTGPCAGVPSALLDRFLEYVADSNTRLAQNQANALDQLERAADKRHLPWSRQQMEQVAKHFVRRWNVSSLRKPKSVAMCDVYEIINRASSPPITNLLDKSRSVVWVPADQATSERVLVFAAPDTTLWSLDRAVYAGTWACVMPKHMVLEAILGLDGKTCFVVDVWSLDGEAALFRRTSFQDRFQLASVAVQTSCPSDRFVMALDKLPADSDKSRYFAVSCPSHQALPATRVVNASD